MKLTKEDIDRKTNIVRDNLIWKYKNNEVSLDILKACEIELASKDEPENYYQANAVKQAIDYIKAHYINA